MPTSNFYLFYFSLIQILFVETLSKICEGTEVDQSRKKRRELEAARLKERMMLEKKAELEAKRLQEELRNGTHKKITLLSEKAKRINPDLYPKKKKVKKKVSHPKSNTTKTLDSKSNGSDSKSENNEKVQIFSLIADELSDPARDCRKFDPSKRARELFNALDDDGNGFLTEDEFVSGCMSDEAFCKVLDEFSSDFIFGYSAEDNKK